MRERQYLKRAGAHPLWRLLGEVSARLVVAMLVEEWIYREDADGYRLEADEALTFRGGTRLEDHVARTLGRVDRSAAQAAHRTR